MVIYQFYWGGLYDKMLKEDLMGDAYIDLLGNYYDS